MPRALALALRWHLPSGTFRVLLEQACRAAYEPLTAALERHPGVRLALHPSGLILDWMVARCPDLLARLRALVERGQVEVIGGGYYEPLPAAVPDADLLAQVRRLSDTLEHRLGRRPRGAWLPGHAWEPHLPRVLVAAGLGYVILDEGQVAGEGAGGGVCLLPALRWLREAVPGQDVGTILDLVREMPDDSLALLATEGDRLGLLPGSQALCWGANGERAGWVEALFAAIEDADWLASTLPGEWAERAGLSGEVPPTAGMVDEDGALVTWPALLQRHPELRQLHRRSLRARERVARAGDGEAWEELWRGQGDGPYLAGPYSGPHLPHLRAAAFRHLIRAEQLADRALRSPGPWLEVARRPGDAGSTLVVSSDAMDLEVAPALGGAVVEWDWRAKGLNLLAVPAHGPGGSLVDRVLPAGPNPSEAGDGFAGRPYQSRVARAGDDFTVTLWRDGAVRHRVGLAPLRLTKALHLSAGSTRLVAHYTLERAPGAGPSEPLEAILAVETNWALLGGRSQHSYYVVDGAGSEWLDTEDDREGVATVELTLRPQRALITLRLSRSATLHRAPITTVATAEGALQRLFQGARLTTCWPLSLAAGERWEVSLTFDLEGL